MSLLRLPCQEAANAVRLIQALISMMRHWFAVSKIDPSKTLQEDADNRNR